MLVNHFKYANKLDRGSHIISGSWSDQKSTFSLLKPTVSYIGFVNNSWMLMILKTFVGLRETVQLFVEARSGYDPIDLARINFGTLFEQAA